MVVLPARRAVGGGSFSKRPLVTVPASSNRSQQSNRVEYAQLDKDILLKSRLFRKSHDVQYSAKRPTHSSSKYITAPLLKLGFFLAEFKIKNWNKNMLSGF